MRLYACSHTQISRLQNEILVSRKTLPLKDKLELDLVNAQIELKMCQERLQGLEEAVECASDPSRLRLLSGENPSCTELTEKVTTLEVIIEKNIPVLGVVLTH